MDLEEKYQQLKNELNPFSPIMNKATDTLLDEGIQNIRFLLFHN